MNKSFYRQRHIDNPQASEEIQMARKEQATVDAALDASEAATMAVAKSRTVRWTARSGQKIEVTVWSRDSIMVAIDGDEDEVTDGFSPIPAASKAAAKAAGIVAVLGIVGVTAAHKAAIEAKF